MELLASIRTLMLSGLKHEAFSGPVLSTAQQLIDYLHADMAYALVEKFRVLFLNTQNRLLCETIAEGSVNHAPVYPREIMRRALNVGATALVLVHNHPSGDATPSAGDITTTRRVAAAAQTLDICIHDHLIVARSGWTSLRALGLL